MKSSFFIAVLAIGGVNGEAQGITEVLTISPTTYTETATTIRQSAITRTRSDTTITSPATTITRSATTVTEGTQLRTFISLPSDIGELPLNVLQAILYAAPTLQSLNDDQESRISSALSTFNAAWTRTKPVPTIISEVYRSIALLGQNRNPASEALYYSIIGRLDPWTTAPDPTLASILSPYPALSSDIANYLSVARTYEAEQGLSWASIVTSVLTLTGPPPTLASVFAAALSTATVTGTSPTTTSATTSSSSAGAAATGVHHLVVGAGIAAAGLGIIAML